MSRKAEFRQRSRSGSVAIYGATTRHAMTSEPPSHEVRDTRATKNSHRPVAFMTLIFEQFDDISPVAAQSNNPSRCYRTHRGRPDATWAPSGRAKPERTKHGERPHSCLPGARSWVALFVVPGNRSGIRIGFRRVELVTAWPSLGSSNAPRSASSSMKGPGRRSF